MPTAAERLKETPKPELSAITRTRNHDTKRREEEPAMMESTRESADTSKTTSTGCPDDRHRRACSASSLRWPLDGTGACIATLLALAALATCCQAAYQFPIQHRPLQHQSAMRPQRGLRPAERRIDEAPGEPAPANADESEQLRQLHQVVDTMAELLNEDEQQRQREASYRDQRLSNQAGEQPKSRRQSMKVEDTLSESAIRQALEDLERMQQQERDQASSQLSEAESNNRAAVVASPTTYVTDSRQQQNKAQQASASQQSKQSALESLIDELGDELINEEQIEAAAQEAERMLRQTPARKPETTATKDQELTRPQNRELTGSDGDINRPTKTAERSIESKPVADAVKSSANTISVSASPSPQQQAGKPSSLFIGQLDPASSELGAALTNDFYNFHAESSGLNRAMSSLDNEPQSSGSKFQTSQQVGSLNTLMNAQNDLEPAAQTRNSVARHEPQSSPFEDSSSIRFDFNQPAPINGPQAQDASQEALVRAFRQQVGADTSHFPSTSTLMPIGSDNFWRPTGGQQLPDGTDILSQQYNRAHNSAAQNLPPLPAPRFQQSAPSAGQFQQQQPVASSRQPQHVHFTGHSLIHSNGQPQFPSAAQQQPISNRPAGFSSTSAPIISVLSGSDTSSGNSVSWNPPASINPPPPSHNQQQQAFNQQFSAPLGQLPPAPEHSATAFFPQSRGPSSSSPFGPSPFQGQPESGSTPSNNQAEFRGSSSGFPSSTEMVNQPVESTTTMRELDRFSLPTSGQWSQPAGAPRAPVERDTSDTQPRSSVRSLPVGNQRFFSPKDLTTTLPSVSSTDQAQRGPQTGGFSTFATPVTTTPANGASTTLESAPGNATKKEDMVIYYYYYYDDNKNATVVAKNISASTPGSVPLDAAIEADGGVEDTPYMDDPAPMSNLRPATTTSTSISSSTTTVPTPPEPLSHLDNHHGGRGRAGQPGSRLPHAGEPDTPRGSTHLDRGNELSSLELMDRVHNDQKRTGPISQATPAGGRAFVNQLTSKPSQEGQITPTPYSVPSTSSLATPLSRSTSANRALSQQSHHHSGITNNRFAAPTESSPILRNSLSTGATSSHNNHHSMNQAQRPPFPVGEPAGAANDKLQHDLINNVLNGIPIQSPRQPTSLSSPSTTTSTTLPTPVAGQQGSQNSRSPLSNASRYGTNNNLMLDPYGLDPAAPATLAHSSHSPNLEPAAHKNWQSSSSSGSSHLFGRKPVPASADGSTSSGLGRSSTIGSSQTTRDQQGFTSQRNSNLPSSSTQMPPRVSTSAANLPPGSRLSGQSRQFFPESQNTASQPSVDQATLARNQGQHSKPVASPEQQIAPKQTRPQVVPKSGEFENNRLVASSEDSVGEDVPREPRFQSNNGRPSTPDGNTSNGFTKSPLQISSSFSVTPIPSVSQSFSSSTSANLNSQRVAQTQASSPATNERASSPSSTSAQPIISTSVSRVFAAPQQVQVTTSVSPPTISSTSVSVTQSSSSSSTVSSTFAATNPSSSTGTANGSSAPTQQSVASSTSSPETGSTTTESSADAASSTRSRKFGNRNNRFQTRLTATALRSTSTTSTTSAPSLSSTTRRPTTSTTRKTSKQLFAGRRRLSSAQAPEAAAAAASGSSGSQTNPQQSVSGSATGNSPAESPAASSSTSSSSSAGRARFGNSFTARTRSTTAAPNSGQALDINRSAAGATSQKPSLFGAQRGSTARPRLPFMKPTNKPSGAANGSDTATVAREPSSLEPNSVSPANGVPLPSSFTTMRSAEEKSSANPAENGSSEESNEDVSTGSLSATLEEEMNDKKEVSPTTVTSSNAGSTGGNSSLASVPTTTPTPAPTSSSTATPDSTGGRNKPKVRPLFASRQRNTSLFGNRRSGNSTSSNS